MAVQVEIRDGAPYWWTSPDIWVVTGDDPTALPGPPVAGQDAYVWAHVKNHGTSQATGVRVDFWWADPSTQVLRSNAHFIGSAFVDLAPAGEENVLCLAPWRVTLVNEGHECLVAVAEHAESSVPSPPPDDFNPPVYREVAQRNLSVAVAMTSPLVVIPAGRRRGKRALIEVEAGGELGEAELSSLGLSNYGPCGLIDVVLSRTVPHCGAPPDGKRAGSLDLEIPRGTSAVLYASLLSAPEPGQYGLVHIIEKDDERVVGGCSFVVLAPDDWSKST